MQRLTREQSAIIMAYTGTLCGPFSAFHEYCEKILGRPIWTHQFPALSEQIKEKSKADFLSLCHEDEE